MTHAARVNVEPNSIVRSLGAGGMGEVSRARDTRLDRDVGIKLLPSHSSYCPEFEREAGRSSACDRDIGTHPTRPSSGQTLIDKEPSNLCPRNLDL